MQQRVGELTSEAVPQLDSITAPDLGFPATFIEEAGLWVFGAAADTQ